MNRYLNETAFDEENLNKGFHCYESLSDLIERTSVFVREILDPLVISGKAENVVFTLTDYGKDKQYDQMLIDALKRHYKNVYFWIQGVFDLEYFETFENTDGIELVPPSVDAFSEVLSRPDIEYVGTRLHAGMFAMQHKKRTIILAIDNRVRDMKKVYDLHVIERKEIEKLDDMIESTLPTDIRLKQENIDLWLSQFA